MRRFGMHWIPLLLYGVLLICLGTAMYLTGVLMVIPRYLFGLNRWLLAPDARTAVVTLTHDPKLDDPALDRALKSQAFYIGALGSRRTHAARLARLRELGHGEEALARIRGPVGLDLEAVTAPEIALSILAKFVAVRRNSPLAQQHPALAA